MTEFFTRSHWSAVDRLAALSVIVLMGLIIFWQARTDTRDPIDGGLWTAALNSPIRAGEDLIVRITRTKVRDDCPVISVREITDEDGRKRQIQGGVHKGGPASAEYIDWAYPIPADVAPGSYTLRVTLTYVCRGVEPFIHNQEPVRFRVVE